MSLDLREDAGTSEAFSDSEWTSREWPQRQTFRQAAKPLASFDSPPFEIGFGRGILKFHEAPPNWLLSTILKVASLGVLQPNWDSYGARTADPACATAAIRFLLTAVTSNMPLPSVVPTSLGGVQLEWHCNAVDLEIEFLSGSRARVAFEDLRSEESAELIVVGGDVQPLQHFFQRLKQVFHP